MSDLVLQPREMFKELDRLPAEGMIGGSEKQGSCGVVFVVACLALFENVPLIWHLETSNST
jgi:hypothetical protein